MEKEYFVTWLMGHPIVNDKQNSLAAEAFKLTKND